MHIVYLIPTLDRLGGAERQVLLLANGLARQGSRVTVIALSGTGGHSAQRLRSSGISFRSLQMRKGLLDLRGWLRLHRWIRSARPDVLHAHLPHAAMLARWSRFFAPVPVLIDTIHSPNLGKFLRRAGYRLSSHLPDFVTAVSSGAAEPWLNAGMLNRTELKVIHNGIDLDRWTPEKNETPSRATKPGKFTWLSVGRLDPVKDHDNLLRAFALLPHHAHLVIAGSGSLRPALESLAQTLYIKSRVDFVGFQEDLLPFMRHSDAFVLASRWEGLPVALIEASACALPSVITNIPGSLEVLPDPPACAVTVGDPQALANAMRAMMDLSPSERRELGMRARQRVAKHFGLDSMLERYADLYRCVLSINPRPARSRQTGLLSAVTVRSSTREI